MDPNEAAATEVVGLLQALSLELDRFAAGFATAHALHPTDVDALGHLFQAEVRGAPMSAGQLARALDLSPPATTALLERLADRGHVRRWRDPADGRRTLLGLEDTARTLGAEFFGPLGRRLRTALEGLDAAEVEVVRGFLARAVAATRAVTEERQG